MLEFVTTIHYSTAAYNETHAMKKDYIFKSKHQTNRVPNYDTRLVCKHRNNFDG